jgi:hypothetical protein
MREQAHGASAEALTPRSLNHPVPQTEDARLLTEKQDGRPQRVTRAVIRDRQRQSLAVG